MPIRRPRISSIHSFLSEVPYASLRISVPRLPEFFDKILALADYEEGEILCPHCGSKNVEQRWSAFSAITSNKSA